MKNIKVIIGANFGDEGKGLMTDYFASKFGNGLVIRFNGGSQAGHTVVTPEGIRHVFSHLGSGTLSGLHTYLSEFFIVNPIIFKKEYDGLVKKGTVPIICADIDCMVTTPYDMLINQVVEEVRGSTKHGSCGLGINETVKRNNSGYMLRLFDFSDFDKILKKLQIIKNDYVYNRLKELGVTNIPTKYSELLNNDNVIINYLKDIQFMLEKIIVTNFEIMNEYDNIIFEGSQGLLLDQNNVEYFPNLTPSNTGMQNVTKILENFDDLQQKNIEIVYVTRNYMTRHGVGKFESETYGKPHDSVVDLTNVLNPYQGELRYGLLDLDLLTETVEKDLEFAKKLDYKKSLAVTCLDQIGNDKFEYISDNEKWSIETPDLEALFEDNFKDFNLYFSYGMTRNTIKMR